MVTGFDHEITGGFWHKFQYETYKNQIEMDQKQAWMMKKESTQITLKNFIDENEKKNPTYDTELSLLTMEKNQVGRDEKRKREIEDNW